MGEGTALEGVPLLLQEETVQVEELVIRNVESTHGLRRRELNFRVRMILNLILLTKFLAQLLGSDQ